MMKKRELSFFNYILRRIFRTISVTMATLLVILSWSPSWSHGGPVFIKGYNHLQTTCTSTWWMEILFLSNQLKAKDIVSIIFFDINIRYLKRFPSIVLATWMVYCSRSSLICDQLFHTSGIY